MELAARATAESGAQTPRHVVVIGGGPAAHRFAEAMHSRTTGGIQVTVVGDEFHLPYDRVALSRRLVDSEDLTLGDRAMWDSEAVRYLGGLAVTVVDPAEKTVTIADGSMLGYDLSLIHI